MDLLFLLTIAPAYMVGTFFIKHDPGPEEPKSAIHAAIGFGILAIGLALVFSYAFDLILPGENLGQLSSGGSDNDVLFFVNVLVFATIEELVKFIPIAAYLYYKNFFNEITDGIIYFSIVGLTFGGIESFLYGLDSGNFGAVVVIVRLALGLFFHGALTSIVGYYFAKAKVTNRGLVYALLVLGAVSLVHGGYNYFIFSSQNNPILIFAAAFLAASANILMFWLFFVATKRDIQLGLAGPEFIEQRRASSMQNAPVFQPQNNIDPALPSESNSSDSTMSNDAPNETPSN